MWARQLEMITFMGSRLETGSVLWRCIEYFKEQTKCKMEKCSIEVKSKRMDVVLWRARHKNSVIYSALIEANLSEKSCACAL